jgi:sporulation protein YlmC with PRC-barrel domain
MIAVREVALEQLLGRVVRSAAGRPVGRIEDLRVEPDGDDYVVSEVILGELGFRARLLGIAAQLPTFAAVGLGRRYRTRSIPWQWLDLTDPERPQFRSEGEEHEHG